MLLFKCDLIIPNKIILFVNKSKVNLLWKKIFKERDIEYLIKLTAWNHHDKSVVFQDPYVYLLETTVRDTDSRLFELAF